MNSHFVPPSQHRNLRACLICSVVQTYGKFMQSGCPNCEAYVQMQGQSEAVGDCTSGMFEGLITLADPAQSWVAKWQRLDSYQPGVYAVKVTGNLPEEIAQRLEDAGVRYIPRDGTAVDEDPA